MTTPTAGNSPSVIQLTEFQKKYACLQCGETLGDETDVCEICGWHNLPRDQTKHSRIEKKPTGDVPRKLSKYELIDQTSNKPGFSTLALEPGLLLARMKQGGHSGQFLANAFLSAYRSNIKFQHSLFEVSKLDRQALILFLEIICMRDVPVWSDEQLFEIEQQIIAILKGAKK